MLKIFVNYDFKVATYKYRVGIDGKPMGYSRVAIATMIMYTYVINTNSLSYVYSISCVRITQNNNCPGKFIIKPYILHIK